MTDNLSVIHPCWLLANGSSQRLEVLQSPALKGTNRYARFVRQYIELHGMVLETRQSIEDDGWMRGEYESSVYVAAS